MKNKSTEAPPREAADPTGRPGFKGYSIEELRYQRAMIALRKEFCRQKVINSVDSIRHPGGKGSDVGAFSKFQKVAAVVAKLFANKNVLDYALVGLSVFGSGRKIYKLIGRRK